MAIISNISPATHGNLQGATAFGNLCVLRYVLKTNSLGALIGSDSRAPIKKDDVLRLGIIPAGFRIFDAMVIVNKPMTGGGAKVGFAYTDGVDHIGTPQIDGAFGNPVNSNAAGKYRVGGNRASFNLPKDAFLTFTAGDDNNQESLIEIFLYAIVEGSA